MSERYPAPRDCPVCSEQLHVTRLGCSECGTALTGAFRACEFCGLADGDRDLLRVFLASRGNMREVERHLGVSYPTARARFDDLVRRLGYQPGPAPAEQVTEPVAEPVPDPAADRAVDPRLTALQALASGELDLEAARARIDGEGR
ncbi:MAG: DUF2089 domain-containing protein [Kineosporiaceae bacterium]